MELPFPRIASSYDRLNALLSFGLHGLWKRRLVRRLLASHADPRSVLDVATGTGEIADLFSRRLPQARVAALDPCSEMMEQGRRKGRRAAWILAGSEAIPLPDGSVDLISCAFGVRNFRDRPRAFSEWARVLRPGGTAGVIEIHPIPRTWLRPWLAWYWHRLMPRLGAWFSDGPAYSYLLDSTRVFPPMEAMAEEIRAAGLSPLSCHSLFGAGMVSISLFRKT